MTVIDLSHPLNPDTPVYPGTPSIQFDRANTVAEDGFLEHRLTLSTHAGTHVDAPAHLIAGAATLDDLPVGWFLGRAAVLDPGPLDGHGKVTAAHVEASLERLAGCDFVLLRTGWSTRWGQPSYLEGFPCLTPAAAAALVGLGVRGVGVDTISVDPVGDPDLAVHQMLLGGGVVIVENLANLDRLPDSGFTFHALPLRITGGDGSPVRAVAVMDG